jgi:uncharacterized protein YPO0396
MKTSGPLAGAAWAVAGAAILGGGVAIGFASAIVQRREGAVKPTAPPEAEIPHQNRLEALARAVAALEKRLETVSAQRSEEPLAERLDAVSTRVAQLEARVEEAIAESAAVPRLDQVLGAVEQMVAAKIDGLDQRLTDQVQAIDHLRSASSQTDALLHRLISAVEALSVQHKIAGPEGENPDAPPRTYPIA